MKCVHTFGTGRHKRPVDIALLFGNRFIICAKLLRPTYQVPRPLAFWFQIGRYSKRIIFYGHGSHLGHVTRTICMKSQVVELNGPVVSEIFENVDGRQDSVY